MRSWHANVETSSSLSNLSALAPPFTVFPLNMDPSSDPSLGLSPLKSLLTLNEPVYGPAWLPNSVYRDLDPVNCSSQNPYSSSYPCGHVSDSSRTNFSEIRPYYHPQYYFSEHGSDRPSAFRNQPSCDGLSSSQGGITSSSPYHDKTNVLSSLSSEKFSGSTSTECHDPAPYEGIMRRGDDGSVHKDYANHGTNSLIRDFSASLEDSNDITLRRLLKMGSCAISTCSSDSTTIAFPTTANSESISLLAEAHFSRPPLGLSSEPGNVGSVVNLAPELSIGPPGSSPISKDFMAKPSHDRVSSKEYSDSSILPNTRLSLAVVEDSQRNLLCDATTEVGFDNVSKAFNHCNTTVDSPCWKRVPVKRFGSSKAHENEEGSDMGRETIDAVNVGLYDIPFRCAGHVLSSPPSSYGEGTIPRTDIHVLVKTLHALSKVVLLSNDATSDLKEQDYELLKDAANNLEACFLKGRPVLVKETSRHQKNGSVEGQSDDICSCEKHQILPGLQEDDSGLLDSVKDDKTTQAIKKILMENFRDEEEGPCMFKNLWLEAEAALCSVNYKTRYNRVKFQMQKSNLQNGKDPSENRGFIDMTDVGDINQEGTHDFISAESGRFGTADLLKHSLESIIGNVGPDTESSSVLERFAVLKQRHMESEETLPSFLQPDNSDSSYLRRSHIVSSHDFPVDGRLVNHQPDKMETSVLVRFSVLKQRDKDDVSSSINLESAVKQDYFPATGGDRTDAGSEFEVTTSDSILVPRNATSDYVVDEFLQQESSSDGAPSEWEHVEEEIEGQNRLW